MRELHLLATDYDGTLIGPEGAEPEGYFELRQLIRWMRRNWGTQWAVVTGRHAASLSGLIADLMIRGLTPDYFVVEDACIYQRRGGRFRAFWWWNLNIARRRRKQLAQYRPDVAAMVATLRRQYPEAQDLAQKRVIDLWLRLPDADAALTVERELRTHFAGNPDFFVFRWEQEVCLMPTAGTKGDAIKKLLGHLQIDAESVLTIGDGPNDITMLDGTAGVRSGCVANAVPEVIDAVRKSGGHIAAGPCVQGVIECIRQACGPGLPKVSELGGMW